MGAGGVQRTQPGDAHGQGEDDSVSVDEHGRADVVQEEHVHVVAQGAARDEAQHDEGEREEAGLVRVRVRVRARVGVRVGVRVSTTKAGVRRQTMRKPAAMAMAMGMAISSAQSTVGERPLMAASMASTAAKAGMSAPTAPTRKKTGLTRDSPLRR